MPLYNKTWANDYEELIRYYPRYYREVREMDAILRAHGKLADDMEASIEEVLNDSFVDFADEETISKLEKMLGLTYGNIVGKTIEERKAQVKAYFIGNGKLSASLLIEMIQAYTDAEVEIEFTDYTSNGTMIGYFLDGSSLLDGSQLLTGTGNVSGGTDQALYITLIRDGDQNISVDDILALLARMLPAHLVYFITDTLNTVVDESTLEKVKARWMQIDYFIDEWCLRYLDGSEILDGSKKLDSARMDLHPTVTMNAPGILEPWQGMPVEIITSVNLHYLDGELLLDGDTLLNSTIEKEEI